MECSADEEFIDEILEHYPSVDFVARPTNACTVTLHDGRTLDILQIKGEWHAAPGKNVSFPECGHSSFSVPVIGKRLSPDGTSVRIAYAGAEPCQFAVTMQDGRLYLSLRSNTEPDIRGEAPISGCVDAALNPPVSIDTQVVPVGGTGKQFSDDEVSALLSPTADCAAVAEGELDFIID